jgi:hypothetical protein
MFVADPDIFRVLYPPSRIQAAEARADNEDYMLALFTAICAALAAFIDPRVFQIGRSIRP